METTEQMLRKDNEMLNKLLNEKVKEIERLEKENSKLKEHKGFTIVCLECGRTSQVGISADVDQTILIECGCGNKQVI